MPGSASLKIMQIENHALQLEKFYEGKLAAYGVVKDFEVAWQVL